MGSANSRGQELLQAALQQGFRRQTQGGQLRGIGGLNPEAGTLLDPDPEQVVGGVVEEVQVAGLGFPQAPPSLQPLGLIPQDGLIAPIREPHRTHLDGHAAAVGPLEFPLQDHPLARVQEVEAEGLPGQGVRGEEVPDVDPQQGRCAATREFGGPGVGADEAALRIPHQDGVRRLLREDPELLFAPGQGLLGPVGLGGVLDDQHPALGFPLLIPQG